MKTELTLAFAAAAFALMAQPVTLNGKAVAPTAEGAMELAPDQFASTAKMFPVDPAKKYIISGEFRSDGKAGNAPAVLLGVIPFDGSKRQIARSMVDAIANTETELAAAVRKGDKTLFVKDASKWKKAPNAYAVAFDIKPDYADLPNRKLALLIKKVVQVKDGWQIDVSQPVNRDYPAGTKVREHQEGSYCWCGLQNKTFSGNEWTIACGTVSGEYPVGAGNKKFWKGTRYVRIVLRRSKGTKLEFRNLEFGEEK